MRFQFNADESKQLARTRFAPPIQLVAFVVISISLLFFFFPKEQLLTNIALQRNADKVAKQYLDNLIILYPKDKELKLMVAKQHVALGNVASAVEVIMPFIGHKAQTRQQWQALWIYYQILRLETYSMPEVSYKRKTGMLKMKHMIKTLSTGKLTSEQLMILAEDAMNNNEPKFGISLFQRAVKLPSEGNPDIYAKGGKLALGYAHYKLSAQLFFIAQRLSFTLVEKREYFIEGLKILQSGNLLNEAMKAAEENVGNLSQDRRTLLFLTQLALASNRANIAEKYMRSVLKLKLQTEKQ